MGRPGQQEKKFGTWGNGNGRGPSWRKRRGNKDGGREKRSSSGSSTKKISKERKKSTD